ncbi:MAG: Hpt domain-containing protein [Pseudomonadota bacterium]
MSELPTIDEEILEEVKEDLEEEFQDYLQCFFDEADGWMKSIDDAVNGADAHTLYETAHALKSSSGYLGASALQESATQLEATGRSGSTDVGELSTMAKIQLTELRVALAHYL